MRVNGQIESRRGRKLQAGDQVELGKCSQWRVRPTLKLSCLKEGWREQRIASGGDCRQLENAYDLQRGPRLRRSILPLVANAPSDRSIVLAPAFTALETMHRAVAGSAVQLASQNVHWEGNGAFTGEISANMLLEHGVSYTIVGHSEPRKYFSESDEQINHRARAAQAAGLIPILCVGESDEQRSSGDTERVIRRQVEQGLDGINPAQLVVAYEPIWAIGTGKPALRRRQIGCAASFVLGWATTTSRFNTEAR